MAGHTKNLSERLTGLERLMGYLLMVHPPVVSLASPFFDFQASRSSESADAQLRAFYSSPLPALLEALALPEELALSREDNGVTDYGRASSASFDFNSNSAEDVLTSLLDPPERKGWSPQSNVSERSPAPVGSNMYHTTLPALRHYQRSQVAPDYTKWLGSPSSVDNAPTPLAQHQKPPELYDDLSGGLHTLATAAANKFERTDAEVSESLDKSIPNLTFTGMEGIEDAMNGRKKQLRVHSPRSVDSAVRPISDWHAGLPSEQMRNQLVDLYFNQIVHPTYPMLDKHRFLRWSADADHTSSTESRISPELFFAVFASVAPYLSPSSAKKTNTAQDFAARSRAHLFQALSCPTTETVQACCLLALSDWGHGEFARAWLFSCLSIIIGISLSLHVATSSELGDLDSINNRTFHSALIIHTLLSLRLKKPPIASPQDYDVPLPPSDGPDNFELWRSDKSPDQLRAEYGAGSDTGVEAPRRPQTVRSSTLAVFSKTASLCVIFERERLKLLRSLHLWEDELPPDLRILGPEGVSAKVISERPRHTVDMHFLLQVLFYRLSVSKPSIDIPAADDGRSSVALRGFTQLLAGYRHTFTLLRSLPSVELPLHVFSEPSLSRGGLPLDLHPSLFAALEELKTVLPLGGVSLASSKATLNSCISEAGRQESHNSPTVPEHKMYSYSVNSLPAAPIQQATPSSAVTLGGSSILSSGGQLIQTRSEQPHDPFQAFMEFSTGLGPTAPSNTVLDYAQWDQTDLLVSLGLIMDPSQSQPWIPPTQVQDTNSVMTNMETQSLPTTSTQSTEMLSRWLDRGMIGFDIGGDALYR